MFYNFLKDPLKICPVPGYHVRAEGHAVVFVMTKRIIELPVVVCSCGE
jgi:hypothetical protein